MDDSMPMSLDPCTRLLHAVNTDTYHSLIHSKIAAASHDTQGGVNTANMWADSIFLVAQNIKRFELSSVNSAMSDGERQTFYSIHNEHEQSLWLYVHHQHLFHEVVAVLLAEDHLSDPNTTVFQLPPLLTLNEGQHPLVHYKRNLAGMLRYAEEDIDIKVVKRLLSEYAYNFKILVYLNRLPKANDYPIDGRTALLSKSWSQAVSIVYDPRTGITDVTASTLYTRKMNTVFFARYLLNISDVGKIQYPKPYRYQLLTGNSHQASVDSQALLQVNQVQPTLKLDYVTSDASYLPVHYDAARRILKIKGKPDWYIGGERRPLAIRYMYEQAKKGRWELPAKEILAATKIPGQRGGATRMQSLFSNSLEWEDYIVSPKRGYYCFNI